MVSDNTIQDAVGQTEETPTPDPILTEIRAVRETQDKLANRLGFLQRKLDTLPQGQPADPSLLKQVSDIQRELTESRLANMTDEEQRDYYKGLAEQKSVSAQPLSENRLAGIVNTYHAERLVPLIDKYAQAGGINVTDEMRKHLNNNIAVDIDPYTGKVDPTQYMQDAMDYLTEQHIKQVAAQTKNTPAEDAGAALGDGSRSSGGTPRKVRTWAQAQKLTNVKDMSDEEYEAILAQS